MKPRTQIEREVVKLSRSLKPHKRELNKAIRSYTKCGNYYHVIAESVEGWQVFRFFRLSIHKRKPSTYWETQQLWYGQGREILIGRARTQGCYYDTYRYSSNLELRQNEMNGYGNQANMMPISTITCLSLLDGWDKYELEHIGTLRQLSKRQLLRCASEYMETLYQQHKTIFIQLCYKLKDKDILEHSKEIKVAVRHHYQFDNPVMWLDCIRMAKHFGIETRNPFYCAPQNLDVLHNSLLKRIAKEESDKKREEIRKHEQAYYEHIKPFLDLMLKSENIVIVPLKSVSEVWKEGEMMHHCVFACNYWKKDDVLLLSAQTIDGTHLETIEFNLKEWEVKQCRGLQNRATEYHNEIIELMKTFRRAA